MARRPRRLAAGAIAFAIVIARLLVAPALPPVVQASTALATPTAPHRTPARSMRADQDGGRTCRSFGIGALLVPAPVSVAARPRPVGAPPFRDLAPPAAAAAVAPARARAPPAAT